MIKVIIIASPAIAECMQEIIGTNFNNVSIGLVDNEKYFVFGEPSQVAGLVGMINRVVSVPVILNREAQLVNHELSTNQ